MFTSHGGHSADVRISLMFRGHSIPVAQLGPGFLLLDAPADHPPGPASIVLHVDESERRWDIRLQEFECDVFLTADCQTGRKAIICGCDAST